ncbi:2-amino-4-hydroxy-6-hydroxymethyldihydropteridine diphosphokinase [Campylobacter sp. RM16190]|uniref:2-amino-4-hydroxy-6- hydroxymethyldihydropteridine diphosphokinase n=1 Tax=Campylobacter sp. RM16190 TaxID=1705727 RepID=UPI0014758B50|nr:2-amino-4-hydroxy-6-hydroxymethyldihydropteridine diphosphokinase [Campylobacter sp. RM16190]
MRLKGMRRFVRSVFFPKVLSFKSDFKYSVLLGIGGNIGDSKRRFDKFFRLLQDDKRINLVESSQILVNEAFGFREQADFYNAVILIQTSLSARALLKVTLNLERRFRRVRSFKNAPRTLDVDILYFSGRNRNDSRLTLPHKGAEERLSVILPLGVMKMGFKRSRFGN